MEKNDKDRATRGGIGGNKGLSDPFLLFLSISHFFLNLLHKSSPETKFSISVRVQWYGRRGGENVPAHIKI